MTAEEFDQLVDLIVLVAMHRVHINEHPADRPRREARLREYEAELACIRSQMVTQEPEPEWRYFYHPESDSLWAERGTVSTPSDPLVEEVDKATFERLKDRHFDHDSLA